MRTVERGQAALLMVVGLSVFLIGALGLALDGAQIYAHRQMAQTAADAAAQAGAMSLHNGTNASGANPFGTGSPPASFTCSTTDGRTPCAYARANGFGGSAADAVTIDFPTVLTGVTLSSATVPAIRVTVRRTVTASLMRILGAGNTVVQAIGIAAIVDEPIPAPLLVTHPTLSNALSVGTIRVCGGGVRSIQVNSSSATAISLGTVDLSRAGPNDPGNCTTGTGADFGVFGGPASTPGSLLLGTAGHYLQPASPMSDPYASIPAPAVPGAGVKSTTSGSGCPVAACDLYSPGQYDSITVKNETALFRPGLYYLSSGGFKVEANGHARMGTGFAPDPATGSGMVIYNTGAGTLRIDSNGSAILTGSSTSSTYKGILFVEDRNAVALSHDLSGGAGTTLTGSLYLTNTLTTMQQTPSRYQSLTLGGDSSITINGIIVVGALSMSGSSSITFNIAQAPSLPFQRVALVK